MGSVHSTADYTGSCSQPFPDEFTRRIVVLGKTGAGKSSLANTLFGETVYKPNDSPISGTSKCQAELRTVSGRSINLIDTPGFFDTERCEEKMKAEIVRCITECAPGPHVFIIVLKVEKYTEQEKQIVNKMTEYFSDEALKFAAVLFTHGDQLPEGEKIEEFVRKSEDLNDLVKKCGNRCHVIDNKYWKNIQDGYRSNKFQVNQLLGTMDKIIKANNEGYYTNEMLQEVKRNREQEEEHLKQADKDLSPCEITEESKTAVHMKLLHEFSGMRSGSLLKVFLSGAMKLVRKEEPILGLGVEFTRTVVAVAIAENMEPDGSTSSGPEAASSEDNS